MFDVLLHVEIAVAERTGRFRLRSSEQGGQFLFRADDTHAAATTPGGRLNDHRESHLACPLDSLAVGSDNSIGTGKDWHSRPFHCGASLLLLAHQPCNLGPGADELDPAHLAYFCEIRIFCQQTVSRMDGFHIRDLGRADYGRNVQITQCQLGRSDANGLIGKTNRQRIAVGLAVNRDRANAQLLACADNAQCNLSAIGNQDLLKHEILYSNTWYRADLPDAIRLAAPLFRKTQKGAREARPEVLLSLLRPDHKQFLAILDGLAVGGQLLHNLSGNIRLDLVQQFHRFDNAEDLTYLDGISGFHKRGSTRRRSLIERPHDWGLHRVQSFFRGRLRGRSWRRGRRWRSRGSSSFVRRPGRWRHRVKAGFTVSMHHRMLAGALYFDFDVAALQFELGDIFFD